MSVSAGKGPGSGASSGPEVVLVNGVPYGARAMQAGSNPPGAREPASAHPPGADSLVGVSPLDRGLQFGDGLFETIAWRRGRPRFLSLHVERLSLGCQRLHINLGSIGPIQREIRGALAGADTALIKLIISRGEAVARGYGWTGKESATRILLRYPWPPEDATAQSEGVRVRIARMRLGENAALAGMKHLNRLEQVLARSEVPADDAPELLLFSSSGQLVSGTMSNVFIVQNGRLRTPRVDLCGVAGVMRRVVLREAAKAGIVTEECALSATDLSAATEVFLTNARIGIWPVRAVDERPVAPGDTTRRLQALIAPMLENPVDA
jgi:4-amino-4-deoxychorismate lyase